MQKVGFNTKKYHEIKSHLLTPSMAKLVKTDIFEALTLIRWRRAGKFLFYDEDSLGHKAERKVFRGFVFAGYKCETKKLFVSKKFPFLGATIDLITKTGKIPFFDVSTFFGYNLNTIFGEPKSGIFGNEVKPYLCGWRLRKLMHQCIVLDRDSIGLVLYAGTRVQENRLSPKGFLCEISFSKKELDDYLLDLLEMNSAIERHLKERCFK